MNGKKYNLIDLERTVPSGVVHYWRQNRHGYVTDRQEAGQFSYDFAIEAVDSDHDRNTAMCVAEDN